MRLGSKLCSIVEGAWAMGLELSRERKVGRASLNGRHTCACSSHEISNWPGRVPVRGQHSDRGDPCQSSNRTAHSKHLNFVDIRHCVSAAQGISIGTIFPLSVVPFRVNGLDSMHDHRNPFALSVPLHKVLRQGHMFHSSTRSRLWGRQDWARSWPATRRDATAR